VKYDAARRVDPQWWLSLDAEDRVSQIETAHVVPEAWHQPIRESRAHALSHVVVENLVARGDDTPVYAALQRLVRQGRSRHDAIHALGNVFVEHARAIGSGRASAADPPPEAQIKSVTAMTAAKLRGQAQDGGNRAARRSGAKGTRRPTKASRKKKKKRRKR
jgi:hypothetical protein